jgi:hypothetical protein
VTDTLPAQDMVSIAQPRKAEVIAFLQDLVRVPSIDGRDGEATVAPREAA